MVAVLFLVMVFVYLVSIAMYLVMRIQLLRLDLTRHRIEWLSFRSGDVLSRYEVMFPGSLPPRICRFAFWTALIVAAICAILLVRGQ